MIKDVLKYLQPNAVIPIDMETTIMLVNALKEALAQQEQEPVQYKCTVIDDQHPNGIPLEQWVKPPQPEQEPVAFASHGVVNWIADKQFQHEALLYSAPQRTWVGLTEDERNEILINAVHHKWDDRKIVKDIEDKLKEKNNGQ